MTPFLPSSPGLLRGFFFDVQVAPTRHSVAADSSFSRSMQTRRPQALLTRPASVPISAKHPHGGTYSAKKGKGSCQEKSGA